MSLHPEFAERILDGSKTVEFRRARPAAPFRYVAIYATQPVQLVVGFFRVGALDSDNPEALWRRYKHVAGVDAARFRNYFATRLTGHAIPVDTVYRLVSPVPLTRLLPSGRPPQSFQYLPTGALARLRDMPAISTNATSRGQ